MSYETLKAVRDAERQRHHAERAEIRATAKSLDTAYTSAGNLAMISMAAGAVLYKTGCQIPAYIFITIGVVCAIRMMYKYDAYCNFCKKHHV